MNNPRVRFRSGGRPTEALTVDYKDVLDQAVENERWQVLRELRRAIETIDTTKPGIGYRDDDRKAADFKKDLLAKLERIEQGQATT